MEPLFNQDTIEPDLSVLNSEVSLFKRKGRSEVPLLKRKGGREERRERWREQEREKGGREGEKEGVCTAHA